MKRLLILLAAPVLIGCDTAGVAPQAEKTETRKDRPVPKPTVADPPSSSAIGYDFGLTNDKGFTRSEAPMKAVGDGLITGFHLTGEIGIYEKTGEDPALVKNSTESFGFSFAEVGGKYLVGAPYSEKGKVFVLSKDGQIEKTLTCDNCRRFGYSITAKSGAVAIGAPGNVSGDGTGDVFVYDRNLEREFRLTSNRRYTKLGIRTGFGRFGGDLKLIVNSKFYPGPGSGDSKGAVWILPTSLNGTNDVASAHEKKFVGKNQGDELSAFSTGDFDGDGDTDLALGSRKFNYDTFRSNNYMGKVYVVYDPMTSSLESGSAIVPYKRSSDESNIGTLASGRFGQSLASGDPNRDGTDDLLIGAHEQGDGRAYLVLAPFEETVQWNGFDKEFRPPQSENKHFGRALTFVGGDVAIGDPAFSNSQRYGRIFFFNK